jgi:hypothetical protein
MSAHDSQSLSQSAQGPHEKIEGDVSARFWVRYRLRAAAPRAIRVKSQTANGRSGASGFQVTKGRILL